MVQTSSRLRTVRADYLIGCDGADSIVRRTLGVELRGETEPNKQARQALIYCPDLYERLPGGRAISTASSASTPARSSSRTTPSTSRCTRR